MSQLRRFTPYALFPETELPGAASAPTALVASKRGLHPLQLVENLYLLDRYGNQELLVANSEVFGGETDWEMRLIDPIPLRPRPPPRPCLSPRTRARMPATIPSHHPHNERL